MVKQRTDYTMSERKRTKIRTMVERNYNTNLFTELSCHEGINSGISRVTLVTKTFTSNKRKHTREGLSLRQTEHFRGHL